MTKRNRILLVAALLAGTGVAVFVSWRGQLQIIGTLPPEELASIRLLLNRDDRPALRASIQTHDADKLGDWIFERRDNRLFRLEVQNTNRVLAFFRTAFRSEGRMLVMDRTTNGWRITDTNNTVQIR